MALTTAQKLALFQVLEVPYATSYNSLSNVGSLSRNFDVSAAGQTAAKTAIETALTAIALDAELETELVTLLTEWLAIGLSVGEIQGGGIGDLQGANYSFDRKRQLIKERVQIIVPFFRAHEIFEKNQGTSSSIPISR